MNICESDLPIKFDKNCINCSNDKHVALSAFKLACLIYHPSSIEAYGRIYARRDFLKLLENY